MRHRILAPVACALASVLVLACKSAPRDVDPAASEQAAALLSQYTRKEALTRFVGMPTEACLPATPRTELCGWRADDDKPGGQHMAEAIDTGDRVNLICELPLDGSPRAAGSCTIHPRRSNRYSWKVVRGQSGKGAAARSVEAERLARANRELASRWMREARTLPELSRRMGALPDACQYGTSTRVCVWRANSHMLGHGTLAVWIGADKTKKIRLRCELPFDGGPRAPGSCRAAVGD